MSAVAGPSRARPQSAIADVDEGESLSLIAGFELRDTKSQARDGHRTDTDVALYAEDARRLSQIRDDCALAQLLAEEIDEDGIDAARSTDAHTERAAPVPGGGTVTATVPGNAAQPQVTTAANDVNDTDAAGSSWISPVTSFFSWIASTVGTQPTGHDCVVCQDPIIGREVLAPCGHFYDKSCILDLFQSATRDESLFPPRCCRQPIPLASVQPLMSFGLRSTFEEKSLEFGIPNRVYCAEPRCGRFLGPHISPADRLEDWSMPFYECHGYEHGYFTSRPAYTCSTCKLALPSDTVVNHLCTARSLQGGDAETLQLGAAQGWARCPGCGRPIELNISCYHITCRCQTEFCYLCQARWKTCSCPEWDENRLLAAAEADVDQQLGVVVAPAPVRRERIPHPVVPVAPVRATATAIAPARPTANARPPEPAPAVLPTTAGTRHSLASSNSRSWRERDGALRENRGAVERPSRGSASQTALTPILVCGPNCTPARSQTSKAPLRGRSRGTRAGTVSSPPAATLPTAPPTSQVASSSAPLSRSCSRYTTGRCGCRIYENEPEPWALDPDLNYTSITSPAFDNKRIVVDSSRCITRRSPLADVFNSAASPTSSGQQASSPSSCSTSSGADTGNWRSSMHSSLTPSSLAQMYTESGVCGSTSAYARTSSYHKGKSPVTSVCATQQTLSETDRRRLVREAMDELRVNPHCYHFMWHYRPGGGKCENCLDDLWVYLLRCQDCQMLACKRCSHNRLRGIL